MMITTTTTTSDDDDACCAVLMADLEIPKTWTSVATDQHYRRCEIYPESPEYEAVIQNMIKSGGKSCSEMVYKV